jgi:type 1 glutamine amidotransferase
LLDGPHRQQVLELMQRGCGLVTIHWASTVQQENLERLGSTWMTLLGGTWISNVGLSTDTSPLKQLQPEHPICRGWKEYDVHDEFYLNPRLGDEAQPLLQVSTKGQDVVVAWAYERPDRGRSYATTLGHFYENFQREEFRRTIVKGILWTARLDIPAGGARVNLSNDQLALPPQP